MFIGRERELAELNRLYNTDKFQFAVIYGRRRVGKTAIIREFIKGKNSIMFTGVETNAKQNLENFSTCVMSYRSMPAGGDKAASYTGESLTGGVGHAMTIQEEAFVYAAAETDGLRFTSFQAALEHVFRLAENERIVLAIDEYPYIAKDDRSLGSVLQMLIDKYKDTSKLFLILCGSSMSYMEDHVLAYKAPLYGRRTAQFRVEPFDFFEVCRYFSEMTAEDKAIMYGITGGTPQYLLQMNALLTPEENIKNTYLNASSVLFEEPANLLRQEMREPAIYNAIITAIATGASKMSEISSKVGAETSVCATYIRNLITLGIIRREAPYGEKTTRKSIYRIEDNMFRFWYRFIPQNSSIISRGAIEAAYLRIKNRLPDYMGAVFEDICMQYLWKIMIAGECDVDFRDIGRWWGTDPNTHNQVEIDIMGEGDDGELLLAECKWTNEKVDLHVLEKLLAKGELFRNSEKHYYLFSKNGFTKGCIARAGELGNVKLVEYTEMVKSQN